MKKKKAENVQNGAVIINDSKGVCFQVLLSREELDCVLNSIRIMHNGVIKVAPGPLAMEIELTK